MVWRLVGVFVVAWVVFSVIAGVAAELVGPTDPTWWRWLYIGGPVAATVGTYMWKVDEWRAGG